MKKILTLSALLAFSAPAFAQVATENIATPAPAAAVAAPVAAPAAAAPAPAADAAPAATTLSCAGPAATRKIAGNFWLVSACSDGKSLVFVASEGNPARPFTLARMVSENSTTYSLSGTGNKAAADAALAEVKAMDDAAIAALVAGAKAGK